MMSDEHGQTREGGELQQRLQEFVKRLRKYSCPSAIVSDEFVNGWDMATHHCAERIESILRNYPPAALRAAGQQEPHPAMAALEHDRTKVAECVTRIKKELSAYDWLITSRGSYEWNDDKWHEEFKRASEAIWEALEPMIKIAADWSNCPKKWEDVQVARAGQQEQPHESFKVAFCEALDCIVENIDIPGTEWADRSMKEWMRDWRAALAATPATSEGEK